MTTGLPGSTARRNSSQQVGYLRFTVNYNDANVAAGNGKQWLPAGALIDSTTVYVGTAFNAGSTNLLTVGTNATGYNNIVASGSVTPGTGGQTLNIVPTGAAQGPIAADAQVFVTYTQSGTAASAGQAVVVIKYIYNNDL